MAKEYYEGLRQRSVQLVLRATNHRVSVSICTQDDYIIDGLLEVAEGRPCIQEERGFIESYTGKPAEVKVGRTMRSGVQACLLLKEWRQLLGVARELQPFDEHAQFLRDRFERRTRALLGS